VFIPAFDADVGTMFVVEEHVAQGGVGQIIVIICSQYRAR
jgi:transketolase C-terminal domain/subunit